MPARKIEEVRVTRRLVTDNPSDITKALHGSINTDHSFALPFDRTNYVVRDCSVKGKRACRVMLNIGLKIDPIRIDPLKKR